MATNVILIFVIVVGVILVGTGLYVYLRNRSMEEIRAVFTICSLLQSIRSQNPDLVNRKWSGLSVRREASCLLACTDCP